MVKKLCISIAPVLLVADLFLPFYGLIIELLLNGDMCQGSGRSGAMPMLLTRWVHLCDAIRYQYERRVSVKEPGNPYKKHLCIYPVIWMFYSSIGKMQPAVLSS